MKSKIILSLMLIFLAGCAASTNFRSTDSISLQINDAESFPVTNSVEQSYGTTTFGKFKFKAVKEDAETMYGVLPLKFNGGYLAADILLFTPALFFNLRQVYSFYEFDVDSNVIRYKKKDTDEWSEYKPNLEEIELAKKFFGE